LVHELTRVVSRNYGDSGLEFVRFLHCERVRWPEFCEMFEEARAAYLKEARGNPILVRLGEHVAVLQVAARVAHEALELPWDWEELMAKLWDHLVSQADDTQRSARALEDVHAWAVCHQRRFSEGHLSHNFGEADRIGRWVRNADGQTVCLAILPPALTRILRQLGYRQTAGIVRSWHDRGWLLTDDDRKTRRHKTVRITPLDFHEVEDLCEKLNCGELRPRAGLTIESPQQDRGDEPLFRVVYAIDLNAAGPVAAAKEAHGIMADPGSMPPVLDVLDHCGRVVRIDLSDPENTDQGGDRCRQ